MVETFPWFVFLGCLPVALNWPLVCPPPLPERGPAVLPGPLPITRTAWSVGDGLGPANGYESNFSNLITDFWQHLCPMLLLKHSNSLL